MYRKIFIIFISVFFQFNAGAKALMVLLILGVSIYLQSTRRPFVNKDLNELELRSTVVSLSTIYFALFNYLTDANLARFLMMFIIISTNIYFLYYMFFKMLSAKASLLRDCFKFCPPIKNFFDKTVEEYKLIEKNNEGRNLSDFKKLSLSLRSALNSPGRSPKSRNSRFHPEVAKDSSPAMKNNFIN